jgi:hypothetical protein
LDVLVREVEEGLAAVAVEEDIDTYTLMSASPSIRAACQRTHGAVRACGSGPRHAGRGEKLICRRGNLEPNGKAIDVDRVVEDHGAIGGLRDALRHLGCLLEGGCLLLSTATLSSPASLRPACCEGYKGCKGELVHVED